MGQTTRFLTPIMFWQTHRAVLLHFGRCAADDDVVPLQFRVRPAHQRVRELPEILVEEPAVHQHPVPRPRHGEWAGTAA